MLARYPAFTHIAIWNSFCYHDSMNKIKILFLILFSLIFISGLLVFNAFKSPVQLTTETIPEFQITRVSGNGRVYTNPSMTSPYEIDSLSHPNELFLKADPQTAFEFIYAETFFRLLPGSSLYYQSKTRELYISGDFYWKRESENRKVEINLSPPEEIVRRSEPPDINASLSQTPGEYKTVILSNFGRIQNQGSELRIWNYSGQLTFNFQQDATQLNEKQILILNRTDNRIVKYDVLPAPEFIAPEEKTIELNTIGDSIIKFGWKSVMGASQYILKIYPSDLRDTLIYEKYLTVNRKSIDILKFEDKKELYWEVYPYDMVRQIEGTPSTMGKIQIIGTLLEKDELLKPPKLEIDALTVSGNMVLIKGEADANSQLFVNDEYVKIDMDGKFIHTITFKTIGKKTILFKLISPSEMETVFERQVSIFEE